MIRKNIETWKLDLKTDAESNDRDRIVVIDNTPLPRNGAHAQDTLVLEYSSSASYSMDYNLRNVSIYMGMVTVVLLFAIGATNYLSFKISKDIKRKFQQEEEEESEEDKKE